MKRKGTGRARALRERQTDAERDFWFAVRDRRLAGFKFRRQVPIGPWIVDFLCVECGVIVEIDGGQHSESRSDAARDAALEEQGYRVVRFWNHDVRDNLDGVLERLAEILAERAPGGM